MAENGYRNGAFALGLVVGGGLALNLILWLDYQANYPPNESAAGDDQGGHSQIGTAWDRLLETFVSPSDTLAQWIMAAFTVGAFIILLRTLRETRNMTVVSRDIGEAQARAYLSVDEIKVGCNPAGPHLRFALTARNSGQSPAMRGDAVINVSLHSTAFDDGFWIPMPLGEIPANGTTGKNGAAFEKQCSPEMFEALKSATAVKVTVVMWWLDVFDVEHEHFAIFGATSAAPTTLWELSKEHRFPFTEKDLGNDLTTYREKRKQWGAG